MDLHDIRNTPTSVRLFQAGEVHESVMRSYQIVMKVFELLERKTDHQTIADIMNDLYAGHTEAKP